jgi:hypothetical protein
MVKGIEADDSIYCVIMERKRIAVVDEKLGVKIHPMAFVQLKQPNAIAKGCLGHVYRDGPTPHAVQQGGNPAAAGAEVEDSVGTEVQTG